MKIALQEGLLPGESLAEKLDFAESLAIEGLEVGGRSRLYDHVEQYEQGPRRPLHQDRFHLRPRDL